MLYLIENEKRILNHLLKNPEDCSQLRPQFFSDDNKKIFKAINDISKTNAKIDETKLLSVTKQEVIDDIKSEANICSNFSIEQEYLKRAYIVRRLANSGNKYILDNYVLDEDNFTLYFDKYTSNEIIKQVHEDEMWLDNLSNLDFDPFKGYAYYDIPGANEPIEWAVDNLFQKGTFNIAVGPAKSGKSQLCYQLAFCMQNGINFFDQPVSKSNVLYVDWELNPKEITHRINLLNEFYKGDEPYVAPLFIPLYRTNYTISEIITGIKRTLTLHPEIDTVFYDNFYSFFDGDSNSSSAVKQVLKAIQSVSPSATFFLVCHTNKTDGKEGGNKNGIYAAAGSNAFGGFADEFLSIENKIDGRIVRISGRHVSPTQEVACRFSRETYWQFSKLSGEGEIKKILFDKNYKTKEELQSQYPELSEFIGEDGKTLAQINKDFPSETLKTLKDKGFFTERNADRCREGFKSGRWYLEDPTKERKFFQKE